MVPSHSTSKVMLNKLINVSTFSFRTASAGSTIIGNFFVPGCRQRGPESYHIPSAFSLLNLISDSWPLETVKE